jgi:hypothetical protein
MRTRISMAVAAALLAVGALGGCGTPTYTLIYKPLAGERVEIPYPSACAKSEGVSIFVGPEALRVIEGEPGTVAERQEFLVELLVRNDGSEPIAFQSRNVTLTVEGATGRPVETYEVVLQPRQNTGRYELRIPVTGRGKKDAREDKVELAVDVKTVSGKTITVKLVLLFVVSKV